MKSLKKQRRIQIIVLTFVALAISTALIGYAMRDGIKALGGDANQINPLVPVDLVIDHSVMIDEFGNPRAFQMNVDREYERNMERYTFLKWGQSAFNNFRVVPPGTGICHQVNLEYLAQTIWSDEDQSGEMVAYPDTLVGTDSHTTMVNGAAVLGWGVGGIEAEAAMLGQPISMLIPEVIGFKLTGEMMEGTTGTDLVLKVVEMLRAKGVVGKFVEFYGPGLDKLPLADRATIANMAPEYGATCGFFPIDDETLRYLKNTGREEVRIALVEAYAKENGFWRGDDYAPVYTDTLHLDMGTIVPAISGPKRPQDYVALTGAKEAFANEMENTFKRPMGKENLPRNSGIACDIAASRQQDSRYLRNSRWSSSGWGLAVTALTSCSCVLSRVIFPFAV